MSPRSPGRDHIPSLDGWRAVAIVLVLGSHIPFSRGFPARLGDWVSPFNGELGVRIFFVLSGFLISLLLLREAEQTGGVNLRRFFLRRIFRILPIYVAYLIVLAALAALGLYADSASSWIGCLAFCRNVVGRGNSGTAHFWSLAVEEQFYVVWPCCVAGLQLWRRKWLYIAILLIPILGGPLLRSAGVAHPGAQEWQLRLFGERSLFVFADSLAVGCLGAWWAVRKPSLGAGRLTARFGVLLAAAIVFGPSLPPFADLNGPAAKALLPSVQAWAILMCLWLTADRACLGYRVLNSRVMVGLGTLSYSLYVWHFAFLSAFMGGAVALWPTHDWRLWPVPSALVSLLSYRYLEQPLMRYRRRWRPAAASTPFGSGQYRDMPEATASVER